MNHKLWKPCGTVQKNVRSIVKYLDITYRKIVNMVVDRDHCHTIGLISRDDDWEYPLWVLFNEKTSGNFRLKHVNVKNESAKLEPEFPDSELCAIVSTNGRVQSVKIPANTVN